MDTLLVAFDQVASLPVLVALVAGSLLGIIIGAIPGLGPGVAGQPRSNDGVAWDSQVSAGRGIVTRRDHNR